VIKLGDAVTPYHEDFKLHINTKLPNFYTPEVSVKVTLVNFTLAPSYDYVVRLHMLSDAERVGRILESGLVDDGHVGETMRVLDDRLETVEASMHSKQPLLSLYRVLIPLLGKSTNKMSEALRKKTGELWIESSKVGRKCGNLHVSLASLQHLSAENCNLPSFHIEKAKYLRQKGEYQKAFKTLNWMSKEEEGETLTREEKVMRSKSKFLLARLMEDSASYESQTVLKTYRDATTLMEWEKVHFAIAEYYDRLVTAMVGESRGQGKSHHLRYIISHYGKSLMYGTSHIYQSITKLLTLWLDFGEAATIKEKKAQEINDMKQCIREIRSDLPSYIFYIAFSQLTSRICHPHLATYNDLKEILCDVIRCYPERSLWSMMYVSKSKDKKRVQRCREIFNLVGKSSGKMYKLVADYQAVTDKFIELCNKNLDSKGSRISVHFRSLKNLVENPNFSQVIMPLEEHMSATLPEKSKFIGEKSTRKDHNPFPTTASHIVGFHDEIEVLASLQKPKKIVIKASDGRSHIFLCKPKDDLRKDARVIEFQTIVNKCLKKDQACSRRNLKIRTYSVIPLNEQCGLIEWVSNMRGLRQILLGIYRPRGLSMTARELRNCQLPKGEHHDERRLKIFEEQLLAKHPPVMHEWFLHNFQSDAAMWYHSRALYCRSLAVMSMVGYMIGLGDRHGENILVDSNNGEIMHVDFCVIFDKGLTLDIPEIVPYRLTHNMVDAMGPFKYEGFFRKACEITMAVIRDNRESLLSLLRTFVHSPLVEWSSERNHNNNELSKEKALQIVNSISRKLRGLHARNKQLLPLSVEGDVQRTIQIAVDKRNLSKMYIGWAGYM